MNIETIREQVNATFPNVIKHPIPIHNVLNEQLDALVQSRQPLEAEQKEQLMDIVASKNWFQMYNAETGEIIGAPVTDAYYLHTKEDFIRLVFAGMQGINDPEAKAHFAWVNNSIMSAVIRPTSIDPHLPVTHDTLMKRLNITAGFGGLGAIKGMAGLFRPLCLNLDVFATVLASQQVIKHTANMTNRMDDLVMQFNSISKTWEYMGEQVQQMYNRKVNLGEYFDAVWKVDRTEDRNFTRADTRNRDLVHRLKRETKHYFSYSDPHQVEYNAWNAYQAVQGHIQHGGVDTMPSNTPEERNALMQSAVGRFNDPRIIRAQKLALGEI